MGDGPIDVRGIVKGGREITEGKALPLKRGTKNLGNVGLPRASRETVQKGI